MIAASNTSAWTSHCHLHLNYWVGCLFPIQFNSKFPIWLSILEWMWLKSFNSTHRLRFDWKYRISFTHHFYSFDLFYYSIRLSLNPFDLPFLIRLNFSGSIWIVISISTYLIIIHSIWLSYNIWFNTHFTH